MDSFKIPTNLRTVFKKRVKTKLNAGIKVKQEPSIVRIKQEPLIDRIKQEPITNGYNGQHRPIANFSTDKPIKMEPTNGSVIPMGWSTASSFNPLPKHEIVTPEKTIKQYQNTNPFKQQNGFSRPNRKTSPPKTYKKPRNRPPIIVTALKVHRYLSSLDPNTLTHKQVDSLTWAESVIFNRTLPRQAKSTATAVVVDIPDEDNNDELNQAFITDETIHEIPDTLQLAIIDSTAPGGRYNLIQARLIEKNLSKAVANKVLENPTAKQPFFGKSVYYDGVLVLDCKDDTTYEFAKRVLSDMKLWPGSRLKLIEPQKTPFDAIACLHLPDVGMDKSLVLSALKAQNPTINMSKWKVLGETSYNQEGYKDYSILMSNPPVYYRRHKQLKLYFGGSEVILKHYGCQWLWHCKV